MEMRLTGHVARCDRTNAYVQSVGQKSWRKHNLECLDVDEHNVEMNVKEVRWDNVQRIGLTDDMDHWLRS
jgi:hypothetical protein